MSRILDFYGVRWEYEPHTFPILWNLDGNVVESFAPDFFLPDLDIYLELTTLRQKLVRKKNRKLRRLRELYPDLNIKLFYARDFRALMLKYGRLALIDGLSGTSGQVASPHGDTSDPASEPSIDGATAQAAGSTTGTQDAVAVAPTVASATGPSRRRRVRSAGGGHEPAAVS
jgi:hypothetical protein